MQKAGSGSGVWGWGGGQWRENTGRPCQPQELTLRTMWGTREPLDQRGFLPPTPPLSGAQKIM